MAAPAAEKEKDDTKETNVGRIEEIQGVVIEAVFPDKLPEIFSAITVDRSQGTRERNDEGDENAGETGILVCEVQQHLGDDRVRH